MAAMRPLIAVLEACLSAAHGFCRLLLLYGRASWDQNNMMTDDKAFNISTIGCRNVFLANHHRKGLDVYHDYFSSATVSTLSDSSFPCPLLVCSRVRRECVSPLHELNSIRSLTVDA